MQRAEGRDHGLLFDAHPRRRPAGQRPRRDPRPRSPRQGRPDARPARLIYREHAPRRPRRRRRLHRCRTPGRSRGVAFVTVVSRSSDETYLRRGRPRRRLGDRPAGHHRSPSTHGDPIANSEETLDLRDRLPAPHRPEGGGGMTAQCAPSLRSRRPPVDVPWLPDGVPQGAHRVGSRAEGASIILAVSVLGAVFMTLIPFIAEATTRPSPAGPPPTTRPPTSSWAGPVRRSRSSPSCPRWRCCPPSAIGAPCPGR